MGRKRVYENSNERKKAYRLRLLSGHKQMPSVRPMPSRRRPPSRPKRLESALSEIQALQQEYEEWLAALPESLQDSSLAERLQETVDQLAQAADLLAEIDPPKGFGRD